MHLLFKVCVCFVGRHDGKIPPMEWPKCNGLNSLDAKFCNSCGASIKEPPKNESSFSNWRKEFGLRGAIITWVLYLAMMAVLISIVVLIVSVPLDIAGIPWASSLVDTMTGGQTWIIVLVVIFLFILLFIAGINAF